MKDNSIDYSVVGIGINVNLKTSDFTDMSLPTTSLSEELGRDMSRLEIAQKLLVEFEKLYLAVQNGKSVYPEWRDSLNMLTKRVRARSADKVYQGIAESVGEDGSLILRCSDGKLIKLAAGDITLH
jgi:biotin-(acetyl-CoA carboxylase) ligase